MHDDCDCPEPSTFEDRVRWLHEALYWLSSVNYIGFDKPYNNIEFDEGTMYLWQSTSTNYRAILKVAAQKADKEITL